MKPPQHMPPTMPSDYSALHHLYIELGLPVTEIARRIGFSPSGTDRKLRRLGIHQLVPYAQRKTRNARGPGNGPDHPHWKGGRFVNRRGYVEVLDRDNPMAKQSGYVLEHRLVVAKVLGRPLRPEEVVHHRDRNLQNNHPDNLEHYEDQSAHVQTCHKTHVVHRISEAGRRAQQENGRAQQKRLSTIPEKLKTYAAKHNVSPVSLYRGTSFPKSARALLRMALLRGQLEAPPSSYLKRALAVPAPTIPKWGVELRWTDL